MCVYENSGLWRECLLPLKISNKSKKISYEPHRNFLLSKLVKNLLPFAYGYFTNIIQFFYVYLRYLRKGKLRFVKLLWKKIRHLATTPRTRPPPSTPSFLQSSLGGETPTLYIAAPASSSRFLTRPPLFLSFVSARTNKRHHHHKCWIYRQYQWDSTSTKDCRRKDGKRKKR